MGTIRLCADRRRLEQASGPLARGSLMSDYTRIKETGGRTRPRKQLITMQSLRDGLCLRQQLQPFRFSIFHRAARSPYISVTSSNFAVRTFQLAYIHAEISIARWPASPPRARRG